MKVLAIINKNAQFVLKNNDFTEEYLVNLFKKHDLQAKVFFIDPAEIDELVKKISDDYEEDDLIVVGGGDGTVSSVANLLAGKKIILGVLPLGTLNHFAKDLNLPLDIEECVKVLKNSEIKKINLASINDKIFINNASLGFYPKMVKERDKQMRWYNIGKFSAMFSSAINIFKRFPLYHVRLTTENKLLDLKTPLIFVGNNEYELMFFKFGSRKSLEKKELCVYLLNSNTRLQFLKMLFFAIIGILNQSRDFVKILTNEFVLDSTKEKIQVAVDGEIVNLETPLCFKLSSKTLLVCTPGK